MQHLPDRTTPDPLVLARMRSLARLAPSTVHEVRGALSAMQIHVELLAAPCAGENPADRARRERYLAVLREQCARLQRLTIAYLDLATLPGDPGGGDAAALVTGVVAAAEPLAAARKVRLESGESARVPARVRPGELRRQELLEAVHRFSRTR